MSAFTFKVPKNELTLLRNGTRYFPQLCADIDAAQHALYLETYIFAADETGRLVAQALQRAALRHVAVHVLLDGFGSAELPESWLDGLREAGVEVQWFRRETGFFNLGRSRLRRLHRKLVVIDGQIAFIGGINILNDIPDGEDFDAPRLDFAVRIAGTMAQQIEAEMRRLWTTVQWATLRKRMRHFKSVLQPLGEHIAPAAVELKVRDNVRHRHDIELAYLQAIAHAQHEIIIANAYFLPGRVLRKALNAAVKRGVRVVLLLQGRVEYRLQHYATLALYERLLNVGIEIYEYRDSYLHAKVGVIDGEWATVGSSNLDPFSLLLAREANLIVRDVDFAKSLRSSLMRTIKLSGRRVEPRHLRTISLLIARMSYGFIRLVVGYLGLSKRH
ncbi:MAG: cardiolipin synthase ClsB [Sideroxydans sp.]|nr:cardiolipin synthase ClsB [Sideroxydans sp.]NOT99461.1 cardiolipin synthase ClsB [Sideroxydans sp.]